MTTITILQRTTVRLLTLLSLTLLVGTLATAQAQVCVGDCSNLQTTQSLNFNVPNLAYLSVTNNFAVNLDAVTSGNFQTDNNGQVVANNAGSMDFTLFSNFEADVSISLDTDNLNGITLTATPASQGASAFALTSDAQPIGTYAPGVTTETFNFSMTVPLTSTAQGQYQPNVVFTISAPN